MLNLILPGLLNQRNYFGIFATRLLLQSLKERSYVPSAFADPSFKKMDCKSTTFFSMSKSFLENPDESYELKREIGSLPYRIRHFAINLVEELGNEGAKLNKFLISQHPCEKKFRFLMNAVFNGDQRKRLHAPIIYICMMMSLSPRIPLTTTPTGSQVLHSLRRRSS